MRFRGRSDTSMDKGSMPYDLRPQREAIVDISSQRRLARARMQRTAKEVSIRKRIDKITDIISNRGSRTQANFNGQELTRVFKEATVVHETILEELHPNDDEFSDIWIEDMGFLVDSCKANLADYLQERAMDTPSEAPSESFSCGQMKSFLDDLKLERSSITPHEQQLKTEFTTLKPCQIERRLAEERESSLRRIKLAELESQVCLEIQIEKRKRISRQRALEIQEEHENSQLDSHSVTSQLPGTRVSGHPLWPFLDSHVTSHSVTSHLPDTRVCGHSLRPFPDSHVTSHTVTSQLLETRVSGHSLLQWIPDSHVTSHYMTSQLPDTHGKNDGMQPSVCKERLNAASVPSRRKVGTNDQNQYTPVDAWIDKLDPYALNQTTLEQCTYPADITLKWLAHQGLPNLEIHSFDGSPKAWIDFGIKF